MPPPWSIYFVIYEPPSELLVYSVQGIGRLFGFQESVGMCVLWNSGIG